MREAKTAGIEHHDFPDAASLAEALADTVSARLAAAIAARGAALLAVSGGKTPRRFFEALSRREIDWPKVTVTLVDERFVPPSSERSNARLVSEHLLKHRATNARFVGLWHDKATVEQAAERASAEIAFLALPLDVVVLGMGADGHTASFFPDATGLDALMSADEKRCVLPVHAHSAGEPRLTLSLPAIAAGRYVALHIEGETKRAALEAALKGNGKAPIATVVARCAGPVHLFQAPEKDEKP